VGTSLQALPRDAPWPQRQQSESDTRDNLLTQRARAQGSRRVWWWNQRTAGTVHGAWCYLCYSYIATWARTYPMTQGARMAVMVHRNGHMSDR
jgi:hypothetical protein